MFDFNAVIDSWNSPPTRHAMLVHLPIVLAMVGAVLALFSAILLKNRTCRALAIGCQVALIAAAFATVNSGEHADHAISVPLATAAQGVLHEHEEMADKVWMFGVGCLALLCIAAATRGTLSVVLSWLAVVATLVTAAWIGKTANYGGELVYRHGVGVPPPAVSAAPRVGTSTTLPAVDALAPAATLPAGTTTRAAADDQPPADPVKVAFFREHVYPILSENCFSCHNPTRAQRSGGLDQTTRETLVQGGRNGPAVVPGKPDDSLLVQRVRGDDPDLRLMPPDGQLSNDEIATIAKWIQEGAVWEPPSPSP